MFLICGKHAEVVETGELPVCPLNILKALLSLFINISFSVIIMRLKMVIICLEDGLYC